MSFHFHKDRDLYFEHQNENSKKYVIPFIANGFQISNKNVLEIGCGEGGVLKSFLDNRCTITGIDLSEYKLSVAQKLFAEEISKGNANFICEDIYNIEVPEKSNKKKFDLIILKDTIEHIHNQPKLMNYLKAFLKENGKIFLGFPPWQMPYGGHQQIAKNKLFSMLPYIHLFPDFLYKTFMKAFGENDGMVDALMEIKETRLSIENFEKIVKETGYKIDKKKFFLINPIYEMKFNLKPKEQFKFVYKVPYLRNFITTTCYYLISLK